MPKKHFLNTISKHTTFFVCQKDFLGQHYFDIIWGDQPPKTPKWTQTNINVFGNSSYGATSLISRDNKKTNTLTLFGGTNLPTTPPSGHSKHQFFELLNDISRNLRGKYFNVVRGYQPPQGPKWAPKNQFFKWLNLRCLCFLISVDIFETNTLTWFGGTTPLGNPQKINL